MGRKKQPHYRIVVADKAAPRDGRFVETLGYYRPLTSPARVVVDLERVDYWIGQGAQPSPTLKTLISKARSGGDATIAVGAEDPEVAKAAREAAMLERRQKETEAAAKAAEEEKLAKEAVEAAEAEAKAAADAEAKAAAAEAEAAAEPAEAEAEAPEAAATEEAEAPKAKAPKAKAPKAEASDEAKPEEK